jgi:hypothetical protein
MDFAFISTVLDRTAIPGGPVAKQRKSNEKTKTDATTSTLAASTRQ